MQKILEKIEGLIWRYYFFSLENIVARKIKQIPGRKDICDIGCGDGELTKRLKNILKEIDSVLGLDIFLPVLIKAGRNKVFCWLVNGDISLLPFKKKSFDIVIASHVVEHIERKNIIAEIEGITKKALVIITPRGFTKFSPEEEKEENKYQMHRSGYEIEDFRKLGFQVYGIGSRLVCGKAYKEGRLPVFIRPFFSSASIFCTVFTYYFPNFADHLLCVKIL